jgi:hypothetical protein
MNTQEQEWVNGFEGKTEAEILTAKLPPGISDEEAFGYRALQEEAGRKSREQALLREALQEVSRAAALQPYNPTAKGLVAETEPEAGALAVHPEARIPFAIPEGKTDVLLEKQIASCAGIIEHLAHYIARYDSAVETCNEFMDRISVMMRSSAEAALVVGRLRGMAPEGRARRW